MEYRDARTTPTVDVISEICRNELSEAIQLINSFNASKKKISSRLSAAMHAISDGEDVLADLQELINHNGTVFQENCPLLFGIINRCELSVNNEQFLNRFEREDGMYLYIRGKTMDIDLDNRNNDRRRSSSSPTSLDQPTKDEREKLTLCNKNTQAEVGISRIVNSSSHGNTVTGWMNYLSMTAHMGGLSGSVVNLWSKFGLLSSKTTTTKKLSDTSNKKLSDTSPCLLSLVVSGSQNMLS